LRCSAFSISDQPFVLKFLILGSEAQFLVVVLFGCQLSMATGNHAQEFLGYRQSLSCNCFWDGMQ